MKPPLDFLLVCSAISLRDFELNRLNQAANLRKHIHSIESDLRQAEAEAVFARWMIDHREDLIATGAVKVLQARFEFTEEILPALLPGPASVARSGKRRAGKKQESVA